MKGRLNLFQASMVRWRELHPYNAVHVVRIAKPLVAADLQNAIDAVLTRWGLTGLALDLANRRFEYAGGSAHAAVRFLPPGPDADETLRAEIETQLNMPFPREGRFDPFRFFVLDRGADFDFGLAYDHFIAAGDSIVVLLKAMADQYGSRGDRAIAAGAPELYPTLYRWLFLRHLLPFLIGLRRIPANVAGFRHAFRPRYPHGEGGAMGFKRVRIGRPAVAALLDTAKAWDVTVNDLLLALLLQTLSPLTGERCKMARRNELAVASIVNIRGDCGAAARGAFGQFLSSFHVTHPVPPGVSLESLARDIRRDTARVKREKLYLQTLVAMAVGGLAWRYLTPGRRARFHGKAYPIWGGISSMHVDALWQPAAAGTGAPEYLRAVPTGPLSPLVLAVTTAGGMLEMGISFRLAAFKRADIDRMAASILDRIGNLCT